ncbi:pentapeptide repeat-containing protein [Micromonospora chokoriensis]
MGLRRYWLARGELDGGRFGVADGNLDVSFAQARMVGVDFSGLRFSSLLVHGSVFERCDFSRTAFDHVLFGATGYGGERCDELSWPETVFRDCVFARTRIPPEAYFGNVRFERCVFDGALLRGLTSTHNAQFVGCVFRGKIRLRCYGASDTGSLAYTFWPRLDEPAPSGSPGTSRLCQGRLPPSLPLRRSGCPQASTGPLRRPAGRSLTLLDQSALRGAQLRREETRRGLQDLVGPPQLTHFPFEGSEVFHVAASGARPVTDVGLGLLHPRAQRLRMNPELTNDPPDRADRVSAGLDRQPGGTLTQVVGVLFRGYRSCSSQVSMSPSNRCGTTNPDRSVLVGHERLRQLQGRG